MRQRKFRIWNLNKKQWEDSNKFATILSNGETLECESTPISYFWREPLCAYEIQQWTSLKDKNGKEIYEGDIISGEFYDTEYHHAETIKHEVVFNNGAYNIASSNWHKPTLEIIGNIFETPESQTYV
jgi:uncharacterized phage protein (TIGR01671 family)